MTRLMMMMMMMMMMKMMMMMMMMISLVFAADARLRSTASQLCRRQSRIVCIGNYQDEGNGTNEQGVQENLVLKREFVSPYYSIVRFTFVIWIFQTPLQSQFP